MNFDLLDKNSLPSTDPMHLFDIFYCRAKEFVLSGPEHVTLSSVDPKTNRPTSRIVDLAHHDKNGFRFFTRLGTEKVRHFDQNPTASMVFWWPISPSAAGDFVDGLVVRIEGFVKRLDRKSAEHDFLNCPSDEHKITVLAIDVPGEPIGQDLDPRKVYEEKRNEVRAKGPDALKKCPEHQIGYTLIPDYIEFNQPGQFWATKRLRFRRKLNNPAGNPTDNEEYGTWVMQYLTS